MVLITAKHARLGCKICTITVRRYSVFLKTVMGMEKKKSGTKGGNFSSQLVRSCLTTKMEKSGQSRTTSLAQIINKLQLLFWAMAPNERIKLQLVNILDKVIMRSHDLMRTGNMHHFRHIKGISAYKHFKHQTTLFEYDISDDYLIHVFHLE